MQKNGFVIKICVWTDIKQKKEDIIDADVL